MIFRWALAAAWTAVVVTLSLLPGETVGGPNVPGLDLLVHFALYGLMALAVHRAVRRPSLGCALAVTAACGALGVALELAQGFVPGRATSPWDALLNVAGAASASALYVLLVRCLGTQDITP